MRLNPLSPHITWRSRGLDALVGGVAVLGLAPFHLWPLMLAALAGLFLRLTTRTSPAEGFSTAFWWAMGYFSLGMFWIGQAFIERGAAYIPLIIPLVLGLFVLLSLFWGGAGRLFVRAHLKPGWNVLAFMGLFFIAEFIRGHLFGGFPWNLPGYTFEAGTALSQVASVIGVYGLTAIALILGGLVGLAIQHRSIVTGGLAIGILGAQFIFGHLRLATPYSPAVMESNTSETTRLRLVHIPFAQSEMMDPATATPLTNRFFAETLSAPLEGITHIVWPEGAVRGLAMDNRDFLSVFPSALEQRPLPYFLFSSIRSEATPQDGLQYFNSAVIAGYPDGAPAILGFADKKRLVPMGEIVPFSDFMASLGFEAIAASFTPAPDKRPVAYPGLPPASVQICYEVIFSGLTESGPAGAPRLILNQSNDAWFGNLHGPAQHAAIARMRSVEEGLPMVRSAANGWSGTVDAFGRWIVAVPPDRAGHTDVALPVSLRQTRFSRITNVIALLIMLSVTLSSFLAGRDPSRGVEGYGA